MEAGGFSRFVPRGRAFTICFASFACAVLLWALIDRGPGAVALDLAMHVVVFILMLTVGAILSLALAALLFAATFIVACLRGRSLKEAAQAGGRSARATLRGCMEAAKRF